MKEIRIKEKTDGTVEVDLAPGLFYKPIDEGRPSKADPNIKVWTAEIGGKERVVRLEYPESYTRAQIEANTETYIRNSPVCSSCERGKRMLMKKIMDYMASKQDAAEVVEVETQPEIQVEGEPNEPGMVEQHGTEGTVDDSPEMETVPAEEQIPEEQLPEEPLPEEPQPEETVPEEPKKPLGERMAENMQSAAIEVKKAVDSAITTPFQIKSPMELIHEQWVKTQPEESDES